MTLCDLIPAVYQGLGMDWHIDLIINVPSCSSHLRGEDHLLHSQRAKRRVSGVNFAVS